MLTAGRAFGPGHHPRLRAAVAGLALLCALSPGTAGAVEDDPGLLEARRQLDAARAMVSDLSAALDEAAAVYEQQSAHAVRLQEEFGAAQASHAAADQEVERAEARFAERIAAIYKRPAAEVDLAEAVLGARDTATALHRAALLGRLSVRSAGRIIVAEEDRARLDEHERQRRVIEDGVRSAAIERQAAAEQLALALGSARAKTAQAERAVEDALAAAERREAARVAAPARAQASSFLPAVDGKVCPVGGPNGFIDSWGYPRPGGRRHQGVDIFAAHGTPLYAVAEGVVSRTGSNRLGGLFVDVVDHQGHRYYYAHLSAIAAVAGQAVEAGTVIGAVGDTGNARGTPPHLHWQFHPGGGAPVNPYGLARALCRPG